MSSESRSIPSVTVDPGESNRGGNDVEGGATESMWKDPHGDAANHGRHSFLDMVTSLEDGAYDISQYCDAPKRRLESIEEDGCSSETAEVKIYLDEVEPDVVTVTPAVSQEHVDRERQRRNSAIIVEEVYYVTLVSVYVGGKALCLQFLLKRVSVLAKAREAAQSPGVPLLLPMVVLSPMDGGFWLEGEGYETACDESGHWSAQDIATEHISISTDVTPYQFSRYFKNQEHQNYIGKNSNGDSLLMSVSLDSRGSYDPIYRVIMRTSSKTWHNEYTAKSFSREPSVWDFISLEKQGADEDLSVTDLVVVHGPKTSEHIQKFDEHMICSRYKFGILYQKFGQKSEAEMFGNEHHSPAMEEFLNLLGDRVKLKGFNRYKAGLDTKEDMTGKESLYTEFHGKEIMFHVSTLLPYEPSDWQQIERKRHIGNDVVTVIFQDENTPFCPNCIKSNFLHVFVVVQVEHPNSADTVYKVAVVGRDVLEQFPPALPVPPVFMKGSEFRDFLLTKMINAEITARGTSKFKELNLRTRQQLLGQLVKELSSAGGDSDPSGKKRKGRHKSDGTTENKAKAKRKPSLNLGNLLLGKHRETSDEYLLSPRVSRRKTTDIVHLGAMKSQRRGSFNDLKTLGNDFTGAEQVKSVTPAEAQKRSVTLPQRPFSIEGDKLSSQRGKTSVRPRTYSHDESMVTTVSPDEGGQQQQPVKKRKSIFRRIKNVSSKRKIHQSTSSGNDQVILLGLRPKREDDPICHSLEDIRMPEYPAKVYSVRKVKQPAIQHDNPDGHYLHDEHEFMPTLSQSVPSSPILDRRGSMPLLKTQEEYVKTAKSGAPVQSYSASRSRLHRNQSAPNAREIYPSPLLKLQQPTPPPTSVPGSGHAVRSSKSPSVEGSQLSLRTNTDSFLEADDEAPLAATQVSRDSNGHTVPQGMEYLSGTVMDDTVELLLRKMEDLNAEVACLREENLHLLRRQVMMDVTIKKLILEKVELERDLAQFSSHMEHPMSRSSPIHDQD